MGTTISPLGNSLFGLVRPGDGRLTFVRTLSSSLQVTYAISLSRYQSILPITYTIERKHVAPLLLYYSVVPATVFAINGTPLVVRPDHIIYSPFPVINHTLLGSPVMQGYQLMSWSYAVLRWSEYAELLAFYSPQSSIVLVNYPDENGTWQQKHLIMRPPSYGTQQQMVVTDVIFSFLIPPISL